MNSYDVNKINYLKLKNYVNNFYDKNYLDDDLIIFFNYAINCYPNKKWLKINDYYWDYIICKDANYIIIYTIVLYFGNIFLYNFNYIDTLCNVILKQKLSLFYQKKIINLFFDYKVITLITNGFNKKMFNLTKLFSNVINIYLKNHDFVTTINYIETYINNYEFYIFDRNYDLYNVYLTLNNYFNYFNISTLSLDKLLSLMNTNNQTIKNLQNEFKIIEINDNPIFEKLNKCITIIDYYYLNKNE